MITMLNMRSNVMLYFGTSIICKISLVQVLRVVDPSQRVLLPKDTGLLGQRLIVEVRAGTYDVEFELLWQ